MNQDKVDMFIIANRGYFPPGKVIFLKEKLLAMDESKFSLLSAVKLKNPSTILLFSIFLGFLGIDRFMIGDTGMGALKLLFCGVFVILYMMGITFMVWL